MNWEKEIEKVAEEIELHFSNLTLEELNWKPDANTWSIAQNLEHLIVVNETYYPVLVSLKSGTYKKPIIGKLGFVVSFFGKTVLKAVQPEMKRKMNTFPMWEPGKSDITNDILLRFKKHQTELRKNIEDAKELVLEGVVISSPANKYIVYKLEIAFDIIVSHELRHLAQAKEILGLLRK